MRDSATPIMSASIPSAASIKALASPLEHWREMLPKALQWAEDELTAYPAPNTLPEQESSQVLDPSLSQQASVQQPVLFTTNLDAEPVQFLYLYDIQVALLRSRYCYAKYIAYRPLVYKAIHFPQQMSQTDAEGVAECLRVSVHSSNTLNIQS